MGSAIAADQPASKERHQIVLFGGHGSTTIFSSVAAKRAEDDANQSAAGAIFLSRCHAAFLEECLSLDDALRPKLGLDLANFQDPKYFLVPPQSLHKNAIVQATTICLYQLLRYIAEVERSGSLLEASGKQILETVGICSGLLPAAVVAASRTASKLIEYGVAAFRLAFRIAYRSAIHGHSYEQDPEKKGPWTLVVVGLNQDQVEEKVEQFCAQSKRRVIRVSAISSATMVSVTGPNEDLRAFQESLGPKVATKFAAVDAWYHGGDHLEGIAEEVMQDVDQRQIRFPNFHELRQPLRSSHDGSLAKSQESGINNLARWVVWHMLVLSFDWLKTSEAIVSMLAPVIASRYDFRPQLISFGPSSEWLLGGFKSQKLYPKLDLLDLSAFRVSNTVDISASHQDDIAIVGMGVHYPKGHGQEELWNTIYNGGVVVSEIPRSRFDVSHYYDDDNSNKSRNMAARHGAFIDDLWKFDNAFFNITPREAKSMDPQQRILLHTAQAALDDAGYVRDSTATFQRATMGCYVGLATGDYTDNLRDDIDVFYSPGTLRAFHSGKISFVHSLSGPSIVTDTACSSSLVSVYQACRALQNGDCTAAIAGGVNTISSPDMYLGLSRGHFLSPTGGCRPFDASADGYCRAEGCGVFILKRLSDAIAEDDQIHGVIKGVEVNQSGNAHSITHPHSETQTQLFQRLLSRTKVDPSTISVVEAHGTGTQAGDSREIASLQSALGGSHSIDHPLVVSSIKGNIGHAEAASGAAGLAKILLMIRKKMIPRQASFHRLNPRLTGLEGAGIVIPTANREWQHSKTQPRRAMLNNFGAAGSNVALLLEENMVSPGEKSAGIDRSSYIFNISAQTPGGLSASIRNHQEYLRDLNSKPRIKDVCYTATARRQIYSHRISLLCASNEDLLAKLESLDTGKVEPSHASKAVVFAFSGQGSIYRGMGEGLMDSSSFFRDQVHQCDTIVQELGFPSFLSYFTKDSSAQEGLTVSEEIITSQCACVTLEYSVAKLFMSWNIIPSYVIGHSLGEFAALSIAGVLSISDTLRVVASRAQMMAAECAAGESGMIACKVSPSTVDQILAFEKATPQLTVACRNSSNDCVVSGPLNQLDHFEQICKIKPIKAKRLEVPYGYHSASMEPIITKLLDLGCSVTWSNPTIPIASNVYGRLLEPRDCQSDYFAKHARQPVRFTDAIESIRVADGFIDSICVEIGPHPTVSTLVKAILASTPCPCYPALKKDVDAWSSLNAVLSQFSLVKDDIEWRSVFTDCQSVTTNLPGYPLGGTDFEVPFSEPVSKSRIDVAPTYSETGFTLLPSINVTQSSGDSFVFETTSAILGPLISGHNVGGTAICPASVYHELVVEAAHIALSTPQDHVWMVSNMSFAHPLIHNPSSPTQTIQLHLNKTKGRDSFEAAVASKQNESSGTITYFASTVSMLNPITTKPRRMREAALIKRQSFYFSTTGNHSTLRTKVLYERMFTRVVRYSREYHTLQDLNVSSSNLEGFGTFKLSSSWPTKSYIVPPVFTDTLLHTAGFIANLSVESEEICICSRVDSVEILYEDLDFRETFTIHCNLFDDIQGSILADAFVLDSAGQTVALCCGMEFKKLRLKTFQRAIQPEVKTKRSTVEPVETFPSNGTTMISSPTSSGTPGTPKIPDESRQEIKTKIINILSKSCGFSEQDLAQASSLGALGIDSLMQIEIASALKQAFPTTSIDQDTVAGCDTIRSLEDNIVSQTAAATPTTNGNGVRSPSSGHTSPVNGFTNRNFLSEPSSNSPSTLHISPNERATSLFCFHDGSGQGSLYSQLGDLDRTLYAFSDPDYATNNLRPLSLSQMASRYAAGISKSKTPSLILAGWSFGGVLAFEAAHMLKAAGLDIKGLILIDSPYPKDHQPLPESIIKHVLSRAANKNSSGIRETNGDSISPHLLAEFKTNAALLGAYAPPVKQSFFKTVMLRSRDTFDTHALCGIRYDWLSSQKTRDEAIRGWEDIVGGKVDVLEIPGNHFEVFDEQNISETTAQVKRACQIIETSKQDDTI